jgi:hypothetical protein
MAREQQGRPRLLAVSESSAHHVNRCRRHIEADVAAFSKSKAKGAAETAFFNNMVLSLDHYYLHRVRKNEGKDGNRRFWDSRSATRSG